MGKRILVLMGSPRRHGNTDCLVDEFIRGAQEAGHETEKIYLKEKKVGGCFGCGACQKNGGSCVQKDDMREIYEKWLAADAVVLASSVYFYTWSSQMKAVLDRTFAIEKEAKNTKFYLLSVGAAPAEDYMKLMLDSFRSYIGCFRADGNEEGAAMCLAWEPMLREMWPVQKRWRGLISWVLSWIDWCEYAEALTKMAGDNAFLPFFLDDFFKIVFP